MNKSVRSKPLGDNFAVVKQEIDDQHEIDQKETLPLNSSHEPCASALKCEYDPDCGCPECRFNANTKTEEPIKQKIKLEDNEKIETELTHKCVKDEFEDGECDCNECIGVESTQSYPVQSQVNSPVQEQSELSLSTEPIDNPDSADDTIINDCPTPDYLPSFFSEDEEDEDSGDNTELGSEDENRNVQESSESNSGEEENDTEVILKRKRPFKCDNCKRAFLSKQEFKDHQAKVHQIGKCYLYKCKWYKCKYFANYQLNAVQHVVGQHFKKRDQRDPIDFLHKIAVTKKSMIKPDRRKLTITIRLNCPKCPENFPNKDQLNDHLLRSHQIELYRCVVRGCSASFKNKFRYHAHKNEVHKNVYVWQCKHCAFETITYVSLRVHTYFNHEKGHFRCAVPGCGFFSLTNRSEMGNHHKTNHPGRKGESCYRTGLQMFSSDWSLGETQPDCQAAEDEQKDENNQSSQTVNKSKKKYHEEFSESDNDSDFDSMFEPSDDDDKDAEKLTESDSEIGESSCGESQKLKKLKSRANESSLDDDTDIDEKTQRKKNDQGSKIITVHLNCWKCDKSFVDNSALNKHLRKRYQIRSYRCLVRDCLSSFNSRAKLNRHYRAMHGECVGSLPCWKCDSKALTNHKQLFTHTWKMHQKGHFKCSFDGCQFESHSTRSVVINHYKIEHSDKSTFACPFKGCGMTFPFQFKLNVHEKIHKKEKSFKCEHCESVYTTSDLLKRHLAREHQIGKLIQYKCEWPNCESTIIYNHVQNAYSHIRKWHFKDGEKRHPKEFLSKTETTGKDAKPALKRNKSSKTIVVLRLNCPVDRCSKHFPDKDQLNIHLSECHQIEKFRCVAQGCSASFQNCFQFTAHKNEVHGKIKVWHCDQCEYEGKTYDLLACHKGHNHEEGHFACGHSGCTFVSRTYRNEVANHRRKHKSK